jgi:hemin uptake protein HemP
MDQNPPPQPDPSLDAPAPETREYDSAELLHGAKEILIRHAGEVYRLRLTRNDKLILQK